jgi:hypothetical protein
MKMRFELELVIRRNTEADADPTAIEYCFTLVSGFNEKEPRPLYEMYVGLELYSAADDPTKWKIYIYMMTSQMIKVVSRFYSRY